MESTESNQAEPSHPLARYFDKNPEVSQAALARKVGVSAGMVWQWLRGVKPIAAEQVIPIERATDGKVSRHELRPDIYPLEEGAVVNHGAN